MIFNNHFIILVTLALPFISSSPTKYRDASAILEDFQQLDVHIASLNSAVKEYEPELQDKLQIERLHVNVELDMIQATKDVHAAKTFGEKDSEAVTSATTQMQPLFKTYLQDIGDKRPEFQEEGHADRIYKHIKEFRDRYHTLVKELQQKVTVDDGKELEGCIQEIDQDFNRALQVYSEFEPENTV
ncbi:hydrophobic surface binding protein A-domain-containing protein [Aspergillus alliaceus]|uniref:Hydrophobic surface binding protein A-domain-containing protein n=1 Tax=Petromyces alliaceus TaxID=209559 RepID=A0A5N7CL87_PETAA|nr:hydrophobic surface binding protein A-domain-containing protein [Aspergillus alliaceus]